MSLLLEIDADSIILLSDYQLTAILKRLLHLEANVAGIAQKAVDVGLNIYVPDGGEDGRIEWQDGPDSTDYLPARLTQFQCKATNMGPKKCVSELLDESGNVKPMIDEALSAGGAYVIFNSRKVNPQGKKQRVKEIRAKLRELGRPYADTAIIEIYDAGIIEGWVNRYISAVIAISCWTGRPLIAGMQGWEEWAGRDEFLRFDFVPDEQRSKAIEQLREHLSEPRKAARLVGLSGLGKTRLALEALRPAGNLDFLYDKVVYIDASYGVPALAARVSDWVRLQLEGILIVDNCDLGLHKKIKTEVCRADSSFSLLTIDYDLEQDPGTPTIRLETLEDSYIKEMLEPVYGETIRDLDRVVSFAQGFPQMAVLLADARLNEDPEMGSLTDDELLRKLLWGTRDPIEDAQRVITGCALFERFGLFEEASAEYEFIANEIVGVHTDDFYRHIMHFKERGLIDTRGRYAQVIPMPLAVRLASDWWKQIRPARALEIIQGPMPGNLDESFCSRVAKLDFLPEVKDLAKELCGEQGPFGQAELILSERGSNLFRSFVEVNPKATVEALHRALAELSKEEILAIEGGVRRNLVWSLEKLCFRKEIFPIAARLMLQLALGESEHWSNNATGLFLQLFNTHLSGTEAPPEMRLEVIDQAIASSDPDERRLAVDALEHSLRTDHFTRVLGAEEQGSAKPLEDWRPKTWGEAFSYWEAALERLTGLTLEEGDLATRAKSAIAKNIRGLMNYGRIDSLDAALRSIVEHHGSFWPEALDNIQNCLRYDSDRMPSEGKQKLKEWIQLLQPDALRERLKLIVSVPPYEHEKDDNGHYVDLAAEKAKHLAQECSGRIAELIENLDVLLVGEQRQGYVFGKKLAEFAQDSDSLIVIEKGLEFLRTVATVGGNPILLTAMLEQLKLRDVSVWEEVVRKIAQIEDLVTFYADFIRLSSPELRYLDILVSFIELEKLPPRIGRLFTYGRVLDHLQPQEIGTFAEKLSQFQPEGPWVALDILAAYYYGDSARWQSLRELTRSIVGKIQLSTEEKHGQLDFHHWEGAVTRLLAEGDDDFAEEVVQQILRTIEEKVSYGETEHYLKPVMRKLLRDYPQIVWPILSQAIAEADPLGRFKLEHMFSGADEPEKKRSVALELHQEFLLEWCRENASFAPKFLARVIPVIVEAEGACIIHPLAVSLIDEFGHDKDVLSSLSGNLGSFSWSGSLVPFYQRQEEALSQLQGHSNPKVREWVSANLRYIREKIAKESRRDEEHQWGIFS